MKKFFLFILIGCMQISHAYAWPFGLFEKNKNYIVTGLDHDEAVKNYIDATIENRLSNDLDIEDDEEKKRAIAYLERLTIDDIRRAMQAKGYYKAQVRFQDGSDEGTYYIEPGEKTLINSVIIRPEHYSHFLEKIDHIDVNKPLVAQDVLNAQEALHAMIQQESCTFKLTIQHKIIADPDLTSANIEFHIKEGKAGVFGPLSFSYDGQEKGIVKESYLRKLVSWKQGECFQHRKVDVLRGKILGSGLFSRVAVKFPKDAQKGGEIPVEFVLHPKAQRSIRAGLSYYTDEGVGGLLGWEHRNFLGGAEKLNADLNLSVLEQRMEVKLATPFFLRKDQNLSLNIFLDRQDNDAFEQFGTGGGFKITRSLNKRLSATVGTDLELTRIKEDNGQEETYGLFSPLALMVYDSRNDKLDPHKGWLLSLRAEPYFDVLGQSAPFIRAIFRGQSYYRVHEKIVLAGRLALGAITGESNDDIPATKRFFAGGGGSVRGFGYQEIGPQEDNDPIGGRSLAEFSGEVRFKVTKQIGAVAFVDAGDVDENTMPKFNDLAVGAGVGLRYYTDFGPLRLDVGVPINKRDDLDQNYQVYISIGQAF